MQGDETKYQAVKVNSQIDELRRTFHRERDSRDPVRAFIWKVIGQKIEEAHGLISDIEDIIKQKLHQG
jgi:hypothetical protein